MGRILSSLGSVAALSSLLAMGEAQAVVIASGIENIPLVNTTTVSFDINDDGTDDFSVFANNGAGYAEISGLSGTAILWDQSVVYAAAPLSLGDTLNASGTFNSYADFSLFLNAGVNYLGLRFDLEGQSHYGWVAFDFSTTNYSDGIALYGAWEDLPNTGLTITPQAVPEPAETALAGGLLIGLGALIHRRRRRAEKMPPPGV